MTQTATAAYGQLTAGDLTGFEREARQLVLDAIKRGATGRLSNRGHVILRSPDGVRTASVARKFGWNRSGDNARSSVERLFTDVAELVTVPPEPARTAKRMTALAAALTDAVAVQQDSPAPATDSVAAEGKTDHRSIPDGILRCADCGWETLWKRGLARHRQTRHGDLSVKQAAEARTGQPQRSHTRQPSKPGPAGGYACAVCGYTRPTASGVGGHQGHTGHRGTIPITAAPQSRAEAAPAVQPPAAPAKASAARTEPPEAPSKPAAAPAVQPPAVTAPEQLLLTVRQLVAPDLLAAVAELRLSLAIVTAERDEARRLLDRG
jgi:hypothetical protein